jgi:hypothetical protein
MTDQEAACFINLKKAMNDAIMSKEYLENARHLAPNDDVNDCITTAIREMNELLFDIKCAVQSLTK